MNNLINDWLIYKQHNEGSSEATVVKYKQTIERLVAWSKKQGKNVLELGPDDLENHTGLWAHKEGLTPSARRPMVAAVKGFYAWLKQKGHLTNNPAEDLPYPTAGRKLPTPMQLKSAEKLLMQPDLETFKGVRDAAILSVLIGCGARISGVCSLNVGSLIFYQVKNKEHLAIKVIEKGKKERLIPAPHETRLLIRAYQGHPYLKTIDRTLPNGDEVLFISLRNRNIPAHTYHGENRRIAACSVSAMMLEYGNKAGLPRNELHPHAARHLFGTELTENDINTLTIQAVMGHADANTSAIYAHLAMRKLTDAVLKANPLSKIKTPVSDLARKLNND